MSDNGEDRSRLLAYAVQTLQLDPEHDAEIILAARTQALGLNDPALSPEPDIAVIRQLRQTAIEDLQRLREKFWTLSPEDLEAQLNQLVVADTPDLQAAIDRLQVVARDRQPFLELVENKNEASFASILKDVFVLSPRESAALKEAVRQAFRRPFWRRSRRRFVLRLRDKLPTLYDLEADWFALLLRQRPGLVTTRRRDTHIKLLDSGSQTSSAGRWWKILILIAIVGLLFAILFNL